MSYCFSYRHPPVSPSIGILDSLFCIISHNWAQEFSTIARLRRWRTQTSVYRCSVNSAFFFPKLFTLRMWRPRRLRFSCRPSLFSSTLVFSGKVFPLSLSPFHSAWYLMDGNLTPLPMLTVVSTVACFSQRPGHEFFFYLLISGFRALLRRAGQFSGLVARSLLQIWSKVSFVTAANL